MNTNFWTLLNQYQTMKNKDVFDNHRDLFVSSYYNIHDIVNTKMYGPYVHVDGESIFNNDDFGIGSDDGHDDLIDYIIWSGREAVMNFLLDPKSALPLAKKMLKDPGFNGDVNILKRLVINL